MSHQTAHQQDITASPRLETARLVLRAWTPEDASQVATLANDIDVAGRLSRMPYPYTLQDAQDWIARQPDIVAAGDGFHLCVADKSSGEVVGSVALFRSQRKSSVWEIGYWLGKAHWGKGYATEAMGALKDWGVETLGLTRIYAAYMQSNTGSGHVLSKLGFVPFGEGVCPSLATGDAPPSIEMIWPAGADTSDLSGETDCGSCG